MGHVTNGLTLAFSHLVWAKRKTQGKRDREREHVKRPCSQQQSQRKKGHEKKERNIFSYLLGANI